MKLYICLQQLYKVWIITNTVHRTLKDSFQKFSFMFETKHLQDSKPSRKERKTISTYMKMLHRNTNYHIFNRHILKLYLFEIELLKTSQRTAVFQNSKYACWLHSTHLFWGDNWLWLWVDLGQMWVMWIKQACWLVGSSFLLTCYIHKMSILQ